MSFLPSEEMKVNLSKYNELLYKYNKLLIDYKKLQNKAEVLYDHNPNIIEP